MLWKFVDVVAVLAAIGLVLAFGPGILGLSKWRQRFNSRIQAGAKGGPPRDGSSRK